MANPKTQFGHKSDLFGIFDAIAMDGSSIIGLQACTGSDFKAHFEKITVEKMDNAKLWLESGGKIELWGWRKLKAKRGGKLMLWHPRVQEITLKDLRIDLGAYPAPTTSSSDSQPAVAELEMCAD